MGNKLMLPKINIENVGDRLVALGKSSFEFAKIHRNKFFAGGTFVVAADNIRVRVKRKKDQRDFEKNAILQKQVVLKHEAEIRVLKKEADQVFEILKEFTGDQSKDIEEEKNE